MSINLHEAFNLGARLAFYKLAEEPIPSIPTQTPPIIRPITSPQQPEPPRPPVDYAAQMERDDSIARETLLARPLNPQIMKEHGLNYDSVDAYVSDLKAQEDAYSKKKWYNPLYARPQIRRQIADRVYSDFAVMPESERIGLDRLRESFNEDVGSFYSDGNTESLHSTAGSASNPILGALYEDEYKEGVEGGLQPQFYSGPFHNPDIDPEYNFSPNIFVPDLSYEGQSTIGNSIPPLVAPRPEKTLRNLLGYSLGAPIKQEPGQITSIPYRFESPDYTKPFSPVETGPIYTRDITRAPYNRSIAAHEMYHHKIQNLMRSHPYLRDLLGTNDLDYTKFNEENADYYANQASLSDYDTAAFAGPMLAQKRMYDSIDNKHLVEMAKDQDPHFPPETRLRLPHVGPRL